MEFLKTIKTIVLTFLIQPFLFAQQGMLDSYIREGITGNLALQQKQASYEQSLRDLKEAKGLFLPSVSLNARYTLAQGGRTIMFPVGDMLNGAYTTLNALSAIHNLTDPLTGNPISFPQLENQEFQFYRPKEHETKIEVVQPIFNSKIWYNKQIKSDLARAKLADADAYKRHLVAEIKTAYFNYLKSVQLNKLIDNTKVLLEENLRVNEKLYANDKVTIDNVYRSKAELGNLGQKKAAAIQMQQNAQAYFNFLLNRPLDSEIITDESLSLPVITSTPELAKDTALKSREEIVMLQMYSKAADKNYRLNRSSKFPSLTGAVNYGYQGETYRFTGNDDFMLASLVLRWDIFSGLQNDAKIQRARLEKKIMGQKQQELEASIALEITNAWYALQAAFQSAASAKIQVEAAQKAFQITAKKYEQGQAGMIEFLDARTTMTNAEENLIISQFGCHIAYAGYELAAGLYQY
ncbi:MAG: TolC family protein [Bacteroidales bacterium]|nr:TolC family protein [Bacteroidales bacterium]